MGQVLLDDPARVGGSSQLVVGTRGVGGSGMGANTGGTMLKLSLADQNAMNTELYAGILRIRPSGDLTGATDTAAIQTAFTTAAASITGFNRAVIFATGDYYINATCVILFASAAAANRPIEIRGLGQVNINQVTDGKGIIEFQIPATGQAQGITVSNLALQYVNAQDMVAHPTLTALGFRSAVNPGTNGEGIAQVYIDRVYFNNCVREIGNTQPSGQFIAYGYHITNCISHNTGGAYLWLPAATPGGGIPNLNIDHWLTAQPRNGTTDPGFKIAAVDNLCIKNLEVLQWSRNLPIFDMNVVYAGSIVACKAEASVWNSVAAGPLFNSVFNTSGTTLTIDFSLNGATCNDTGGSFKPVFIRTSGTCNITVTSAQISFAGTGGGTGKFCLASGTGKCTWINQPSVFTLGGGPAVLAVTNSTNDPGGAAGIEFATNPGGTITPDMGDASSTWCGITTAAGNASAAIEMWNTPLTGNRTKTLTTAAGSILDTFWQGCTTRTVRTAAATGASNLTVGSGSFQKVLAAGQYCEHSWNRTTGWQCTASGSV